MRKFIIILLLIGTLDFTIRQHKSKHAVWLSREASILINLPILSNLDDTYSKAYVNVYTNNDRWKYIKLQDNHIAWFENGLSIDILTSETKNLVFEERVNNKYWIDISKPESKKYILDMFKKFRSQYNNVVHLDDHWAIPSVYGNYTEELTSLTKDVVNIIGPISLSVHPKKYALEKYNQDWKSWLRLNLVSEIVLQNYVRSSFTDNLNQFEKDVRPYNVDYSIGVYLGEVISPLEVKDLVKEVEERDIKVALFPFRTAVLFRNY